MGLGAEIVDFVGPHLGQDPCQVRRIGEIPVMQLEPGVAFVGVLVDVVDPLGVEERGAALDAVDLVALLEQELGQVGPVLARDAGDEGGLRHRSFLALVAGCGPQTPMPKKRASLPSKSLHIPRKGIRMTSAGEALKRKLIFDVGMHTGQDTEFYLAKGFWVVAVEANPELVEEGRKKFADAIASGRLHIEACGIGREEGRAEFYVNPNRAFSSFVREIGERGGTAEKIEVPVIELNRLFRKFGIPYYLKIDIEGHDDIALAALQQETVLPKYVSVENGHVHMLDMLRDLGYSGFKFVNQAEVPKQKLPVPALEGQEAEFQFSFGASGAFGFEAPGEWLDYDRVRRQIEAYWSLENRDANIHGWYDLHAMLRADY